MTTYKILSKYWNVVNCNYQKSLGDFFSKKRIQGNMNVELSETPFHHKTALAFKKSFYWFFAELISCIPIPPISSFTHLPSALVTFPARKHKTKCKRKPKPNANNQSKTNKNQKAKQNINRKQPNNCWGIFWWLPRLTIQFALNQRAELATNW